jgi:Zn finger protein HypA/HybF involved in hydrogenase expression
MYKFTDEDRERAKVAIDLANLPTVFTNGSRHAASYIKRLLIEYKDFEYRCEVCQINEWNGKELKLHLDHIDGNHRNNEVSNLRFLCPNCHAQTDTYCGKGNTGSHKVSDEDMINAIVENKNVRSTLLAVGLTPKGGNYTRVRELMHRYNLSFKRK